MAHGGGGELMQALIREHVLPRLGNPLLAPLTDAAELGRLDGDVVMTTDSFVVSPLRFPGGDIGRLAVCGTVNDLAMMGAEPVALSLGLVLEEGLSLTTLDEVLDSVAAAAEEAGVRIAAGDTKVIDRRGAALPGAVPLPDDAEPAGLEPGMFINTAGVGIRPFVSDGRGGRWAPRLEDVRVGDAIVINGRLAEHGLAVMSVREGLSFDSALRSDAAPLNSLVQAVLRAGLRPRFLRDPTRGGLAAVLADLADGTGLNVEIDEPAIPVTPTARYACELLGLDPLTVANEGKCVIVVAPEEVEPLLACLRTHPLGGMAAVIGCVTAAPPFGGPIVELVTPLGGRRIIQRPYGEELPRIC